MLEKIRKAEEAYLERVPINLQGSEAYANIDVSLVIVINMIFSFGISIVFFACPLGRMTSRRFFIVSKGELLCFLVVLF